MFNNLLFNNFSQDNEDYNKLIDEVMNVDYSIFYRGTVIDNDDPDHLGRVRVRVPQIYGSEEQREEDIYTPNHAIPWASSAVMVGAGNNTGAYLIPNIGDVVFITFENGDPELPIYFGGLLTSGGTERFIGTKDANGDGLYKSSGVDFNTDIKNKAQRVIYKSLKGATIIIDDKDGSESIKIVDQLGQIISMENHGTGTLNRDRSGGTESKVASGRIVVKDAYDDSVSLCNGEIHIKAPKLTLEVDEVKRVGLDDEFPDEVNLADEILGGGEGPTPSGYGVSLINNTDDYVVVGFVYREESINDYDHIQDFDSQYILKPQEEAYIPFTELDDESAPDHYSMSVITKDLIGDYNINNYWHGVTQQTVYIADCLRLAKSYVPLHVDFADFTEEEIEDLFNRGSAQTIYLENLDTGRTYRSNLNTNRGFSLGCNIYFEVDPDTETMTTNYFIPYNENNCGYTQGDYGSTEVPLEPGQYNYTINFDTGSTMSGNLYLFGPTRVYVENPNQYFYMFYHTVYGRDNSVDRTTYMEHKVALLTDREAKLEHLDTWSSYVDSNNINVEFINRTNKGLNNPTVSVYNIPEDFSELYKEIPLYTVRMSSIEASEENGLVYWFGDNKGDDIDFEKEYAIVVSYSNKGEI